MADFLSTLFGGGAEKDAAAQNQQLLQQYGTQGNTTLADALQTGTGITGNELTSGQNIIGGGQNMINAGQQQGAGYLNAALPQQVGAVQGGIGSLTDLANKYGAGGSMFLNALGLNGPQGTQAAQGAFTTSPGYQQGIDSGLDAINRRRALGGMADSGNADVDAMTLAQNAQNQQYNGWLSNLQGLISPEMSATQSAAALSPQLASIYGNNANSLANLSTNATNQGLGLVGQNLGLTTGVAGQNLGLTQSDAANKIALLTGQTQGGIADNNMVAQGEASGAKNLMNAAMGIGTALISGGTAGFGGSPLAALGKFMPSGASA